MNLDISALGAAEQAQLAGLLAKMGIPALPPVVSPVATPAKRKPAKRRTQVKYFTQTELASFFKVVQAASVRDYALFRIMYHRGLRASEIGLIQLADLDLRDERIDIRRLKGSRGGQYHLTANEVRALRAWIKLRGNEPGPLFRSRQGTPLSQPRLDRMIKHYGALANLPQDKLHCHTMKHSCGTHLAQKGHGLEAIQDHLGHRSVENSRIYADFGGELREARDKRLRDW